MRLTSLSDHSSPPGRVRRLSAGVAAVLAAAAGLALAGAVPSARAAAATTAWQNGSFQLSPGGVVSRSDIVLGQPNVNPTASIPLGNGGLGVAAWAANGFTAQLNRSDTMPDRKSPGQVTIPGLSVISSAANFTGELDLTDGVLQESGGGMTMKAWVSTSADELIIDVTGANPATAQTATLSLWSGRNPAAAVSGTTGTLAETWTDNSEAGASGQTFGSLAAITAAGSGVTTSVTSSTSVQASFKPNADGTFRVVVAAPSWNGGGGQTAAQVAAATIGSTATAAETTLLSAQSTWWGNFWTHSGLVQLNSADGNAAYIENLRTLYLFEEAASERAGTYPGNQAGDADMFDWSQDKQTWTPSEFWLWNMRAEISANMSSGNYQLNVPIFNMYINDLANIEAWTKSQMGGLPGACVPEVMRFNGNGGSPAAGQNSACSEPGSPNWNALDITSGPELSLYMWEQYQATGSKSFLTQAFPFMEATAQFLLAYQQVGTGGLLHAVANAHETQWAVQDPTTDIAADQALFPVIGQAAQIVGDTSANDPLLAQFSKAISEIPPYPRTDDATRTQLLNPDYTQAETTSADATGTDMIAISYQPTAKRQNGENIELEPLWPWNQVSDQNASLYALEQRSYTNRPNKGGNDWSFDAVDAARLEQSAQVESNLVSLTESHQVYPNGFADIGSTVGYQPYMEQSAGVAAAVDEALAQDYDGIIRFAPAWPADWDASGSVYIQNNDKVDVQVEGGQLVTAAIEAGTTGTVQVKNPWPGQSVQVVSGSGSNAVVVSPTTSSVFSVPVQAGQSYLVEQVSAPTTGLPFASVTGTAPTTDRHLGGRVQIGLDPVSGSSGTAVVGSVVGSTNYAYGMAEDETPSSGFDGPTTASDIAGLSARTSTNSNIYFNITDSIAHAGNYSATFKIEYYDTGTGSFQVQYDDGSSDPYKAASPTVSLTGTNTWKTAAVTATGAYFGGLQHSAADFRLRNGSGQVTVHSIQVTITGTGITGVTDFPPAIAISSPAAGATISPTAAISGTSEPDAGITVTADGATACTATASDAGTWTCTPGTPLAAGTHTLVAKATDAIAATATSPSVQVTVQGTTATAVVGSVVGSTNYAYGMAEDETPSSGFDGPTTASDIAGLSARTSTNSNIYFNITDSIAHAGNYSATFKIEYYDTGTGSFQVQYDDGSSDPYKAGTPTISLTNTGTWKTATVTATGAYFGGLQHSAADFRLRNGSGQVTVHSIQVTITGTGITGVTDFPPAIAITAPAAGATITPTTAISGTSEPDATVTVTADTSTAVCTATATDSGTWTCTPGTPLTDGTHTLTAKATDAIAATATSPSIHVTVTG